MPSSQLLCLLDDVDAEFGEPHVFMANAAAVRRVAGGPVTGDAYLYEAAGRGFFARFERIASDEAAQDTSFDDEASSENGAEEEKRGSKDKADKSTGGALKISDLLKDVNLYELLGVPEGASQEDIKKAYRGLVLTAHPDKLDISDPDEKEKAQEHFVKIQEAYELISDPSKRMQYDSQLDFDDSLPKFKPDNGVDFFEVFDEAFKRNSRFSIKKPVPSIGNADTPAKDWKHFYDFWYGFQSWRDPLMLAQKNDEELHNLEEAECREEKRWMVRENARIAKFYKQAEKDRIRELVERAEKYDPRVIAERDAKKAAKQAEMARRAEEKLAVQRAKEEAERLRQEAAEAERLAQEQRRKEEKAIKEAARNEVKKRRQHLRAMHASVKEFVMLEQVNEVCLQFDEPALRQLGSEIEGALKGEKGVESATALFYKAIESIGLKPMQPAQEDNASTTSGPPTDEAEVEEEEVVETPEERKQREKAAEERRKQDEARRKAEEAKAKELRAKQEAQKAIERKKAEEKRLKEQKQAEAAEKKRRDKEKKDAEKKKKDEEKEAAAKEAQREEAKRLAREQAEKDKEAALAKQMEQEGEKLERLFEMDRIEKLGLLEELSKEALAKELHDAAEADLTLRGAFWLLKDGPVKAGCELVLDRAMALVCEVSPVWALGLAPPQALKLPNNTRNRVKKARSMLNDVVIAFVKDVVASSEDATSATDTQRGIVDGSLALPVWTVEAREAELASREAVKAKPEASEASTGVKAKKAKGQKNTKPEEEDLDALFKEFGVEVTESKKKSKNKKK